MRKLVMAGWWLALVMASVGVAVAAEEPAVEPLAVSLEDAIELALEHNLELARGALEVQGAELARRQAVEAARGLRVSPEGSAGTGSDGRDWRAGLRAEAVGPAGTRLAVTGGLREIDLKHADETRRGEARVEVTQPLFRQFGALVRDEPAVAASETLMAARRAWERDRSRLVLQVVEMYEDLVFRRRHIERDEALAARLEGLAALADAREQQGRAARTEVLRLDLQRGEAEARLEANRSRLEIALQEFANALGLPLDSVFLLRAPPLLELELTGPEQALAVALAERPDYAQALYDIQTGNRQARLARRGLLPDLSVTARHSLHGEGGAWSDAGRLDQDEWFVGVAADMNLNQREARLAVARSEVEVESRRQVAEIVRRRLALEVNGARAAYLRARAELELARRNRELAVNRAELARALFEAERGLADAVSDAEADLSSADLAELAAQQEASVSAYRLLHVLGTLIPAPRELLAEQSGAVP